MTDHYLIDYLIATTSVSGTAAYLDEYCRPRIDKTDAVHYATRESAEQQAAICRRKTRLILAVIDADAEPSVQYEIDARRYRHPEDEFATLPIRFDTWSDAFEHRHKLRRWHRPRMVYRIFQITIIDSSVIHRREKEAHPYL